MTYVFKAAALVVTQLMLILIVPQCVRAQPIPKVVDELSLSARTPPNGVPAVISSARAYLIDDMTGGRLNSQLIMGHSIADLDTQAKIYETRVVSEVGDASNQATASGVLSHCYAAGMAVHVNAYNLHPIFEVGQVCTQPYEPPPKPEVSKENCPVLLDLQQNGFHLSGPDPAVHFDIDADGIPDEIAWTQAGGDDAFLCWDRNRNGAIDDGRELFGYASPLLSGSPAKVGYRSLAELDQPELGGNGDGEVDAKDLTFRELCAWVDANRDGVSQLSEVHALEEVGVLALEYRYKTTHLRDSFGNLFRYVSSAKMRSPLGAVKSWPTFDVIFAEAAANRRVSGAP